MANYYAAWRSNYFKVKDAQAFKEWADHMPDVRVCHKDGGDDIDNADLYAVMQNEYTDGAGIPSFFWDEETDESIDIDFAGELAKHLQDGEVAILMESGAEKLRYITGYAVAIKSDGSRHSINLDDIYDWVNSNWGVNPTLACY